LDLSIQNQILTLLMALKERHHLSILFITHDLSVARRMSDRVMVMQTGQIKGIGTPEKVFTDSADPYIRALDRAVFTFDGRG
jgi:ABC-type oligopeptide transport system ATPase subunit